MMRSARWLALAALVAVVGCQETKKTSDGASSTTTTTGSGATSAPAAGAEKESAVATGLKIEEVLEGTGKAADTGMLVSVRYTGWLTDGTQFDTSGERGYPFTLGKGEVIKGWDEGVKGMKVGGKRKLTIPPDMAYGDRGFPPVIPPNATLVFNVELLEIK